MGNNAPPDNGMHPTADTTVLMNINGLEWRVMRGVRLLRSSESYSELKRKLAGEHPQSIDGYMDGKDGFIKEIDRRAAQWRTSQAV